MIIAQKYFCVKSAARFVRTLTTLMGTRVDIISYFCYLEAERFIQADVGTQKDQLLLTNFFAQTNRFQSPGLESFGLIVLEAEFLRSSNRAEIKILLCKSTL